MNEAIPAIMTFDIKVAEWREIEPSWSVRIEVPADTTLRAFHFMIQQLVDFDNDHLHQFVAGRTWRGQSTVFSEPLSPVESDEGEKTTLAEIFPLPKGHNLFYHFDFGDDWVFGIAFQPRAKQSDARGEFPRIVTQTGTPPKQYNYEDQ